MTGYGGAKAATPYGQVSVEFKTVNHRYLEFSARVPRDCLWAEERLRSLAQGVLSRGKVECFLRIDHYGGEGNRVAADRALAAEYCSVLRSLAEENLGGFTALNSSVFLRMPGVLSLEQASTDAETLWAAILPVAQEALDGLLAMRRREGLRLCEDLNTHLALLEESLDAVAEQTPRTVQLYRERIEARIRELLDGYKADEARLLTETALFAERIAVDEETSRLAAHVAHMREYLQAQDEPIGRRLDFLTQEMNREANTIGSKSPDGEITARVLDMKSEIEKIREQVQNIE
jgi:uncharacterized protein (TIGR00255 family)